MQATFDFVVSDDVEWIRDRLRTTFAGYRSHDIREPLGQLVKSLISSRTKDEVSLRAYQRLLRRFPRWRDLAAASPAEIERAIHDVTFASDKAVHLKKAFGIIAAEHPDLDLAFLKTLPVPRALAWLQKLPGVGRKVAASTLNFSTLHMPAFVVDTHVLRVFARFGRVGTQADIEAVYDAVMADVPQWTAAELSEFHVLVKQFGQTFCSFDKPACVGCPLGLRCRYARIVGRPLS